MKIALITYQTAHKKTQDVLSGLLFKGYKNITLFALPFVERSMRPVQFQHRFSSALPIHPKEIALNLGLKYLELEATEIEIELKNKLYDVVLIGGAGLLPESLAMHHSVINAHPGLLPKVKGLDALKWAILNDVEEIGVTTHFISEKADEGILIERKIIPLYKEDSFQTFALRQYETEIEMLIDAVELSQNLKDTASLNDDTYKATMRMPIRLESEMIEKFEKRRLQAPSQYSI